MAILIDPPLWPAHGTLWSHLVSDSSYDELHEFAARMPVPRRGFDFDHYDVPASMYDRAISLGAIAVEARDVVYRLRDSGLRVRQVDKVQMRPVRRRQFLQAEWGALADVTGISASSTVRERWLRLGDDLVTRWNEAHRTYHDERHLEDVLLSLDQLQTRGEHIAPATLLATWFHDAVYAGETGEDERRSAALAVRSLEEFDLAPSLVQQVGELIVATTPSFITDRDTSQVHEPLAHLLDADLSIFASSDTRYLQYSTAVRSEYAHVPEPDFRVGRATILRGYLEQRTIYRTHTARSLWETRARLNLEREIRDLS